MTLHSEASYVRAIVLGVLAALAVIIGGGAVIFHIVDEARPSVPIRTGPPR